MLTEKEKINKQRNLSIIDTILLEKNSLSLIKKNYLATIQNGGPGRTRTSDQWIMSPLL